MDLIDLQSCPDGPFKFLLNYQDHGVEFYDNHPLESKRTAAIAFALIDIFTLIGVPAILQTDNGREFSGAAGKHVYLEEVIQPQPYRQSGTPQPSSLTIASISQLHYILGDGQCHF